MKRQLSFQLAIETLLSNQIPDSLVSAHISHVPQNPPNALGQPRPALFLTLQLSSAFRGERVKTRLAILIGDAPLGADPAFLFHTVQRRIKGSFFDAEQFFGNVLDVSRDGVAVHLSLRAESFQYQQGKGALQNVVLGFRHVYLSI